MPEQVTLTLPQGTRQRLEAIGFPCTWREVLQFLIAEGLNVIEKHRGANPTN